MIDAHVNFAISSVATIPSPATSGTTLVVSAATGNRFPAPPFNATIGPGGVVLTSDNSEIVRVTAVTSDTMTITRAQEDTTARTVLVGDQFFAGITAGFIDQLASANSPSLTGVATFATAAAVTPSDGKIGVFARAVANRMMLAQIGPSGLDTVLQPSFARNKVSFVQPNGNSTTLGVNGLAVVAAGTATTKNWVNGSLYNQMRGLNYLVPTAAVNAIASFRTNAAQFSRGSVAGTGGFHLVCRWAITTGGTTTTKRAFVGMKSGNTAPTDVQPSSLVDMCGMGWDSGDTNIQWMFNDASGVASKVDLGPNFPIPIGANSDPYEVAIFCAPAGDTVYYEITNLATGAVATGSSTTNLPTKTVGLQCLAYTSVGGTSSIIGITLFGIYIETDY